MAKINNAGINSDDIQKTKDYANVLDKLQNSLNGVNNALPEFSSGIDSGLKGIASKLPDVVNSMMKLNAQNKELVANGQKFVSVFTRQGYPSKYSTSSSSSA